MNHDQIVSWQKVSNYLCCLEAPFEKFGLLFDKLEDLKIKYSVFKEPDIGDQITAFCVGPISREQHRKIFGNLKLLNHE